MEQTFSVITEGHSSLSQTNGVFARRNAIEFFQFSLIDALQEHQLFGLGRNGRKSHTWLGK